MNEWINKKCKIFIRNLANTAIVYTGTITSIDEEFITFIDRYNERLTINKKDVIIIKGAEEDDRR